MAWIESHETLSGHPKTKRLARMLNESLPSVIGRLHMLWWWAMSYAEDGDLSKYVNEDIADAVLWEGHAEEIVAALIQSGFIDRDGESMVIHDWWDYAGRLIDKRKANAERMRNKRATHVQRTTNARAGATVPNRTVPNLTNKEDDDQSARPTTNLYERIEEIMQIRLVKPNYILVGDDYNEAQRLVSEGFTDEEIFLGIAHAFATQKPRTFKYCAEVIRTMKDALEGVKQTAAGGERSGGHQRNPSKTTVSPNEYRKDKPGAY